MSKEPFEISYGPHPNQHILNINTPALFKPGYDVPTLIYIHGGAWRDPNNTSRDPIILSKSLNETIPLASIDYRLSSEVKHPSFVNDVFQGIERLIQQQSIKRFSLIGHSVGATLILQFLHEWKANRKDLSLIDSVYLVDGIYDLNELVKEYPDYEGFVNEAHDNYKEIDELSVATLKGINVHVIHSYEDEPLSLKQTKWLINRLEELGIDYRSYIANLGKHDEVYQNEKVAKYINATYF